MEEIEVKVIPRLVAKVMEMLAQDNDVLYSLKRHFDVNNVDMDLYMQDDEVIAALRSVIIKAIENMSISSGSSGQGGGLYQYADIPSRLRIMCDSDEEVIEALTKKLKEFIIAYAEKLDPRNDSSLRNNLISPVDYWFKDNIKNFLANDKEVKAAMAERIKQMLLNQIEQVKEEDLNKQFRGPVMKALTKPEIVKQALESDVLIQQTLKDKMKSVLSDWIQSFESDQSKVIEMLGESPPLLALADEVVKEMLQDAKYREMMQAAIQKVLQSPESFSEVVGNAFAQVIERQAEKDKALL